MLMLAILLLGSITVAVLTNNPFYTILYSAICAVVFGALLKFLMKKSLNYLNTECNPIKCIKIINLSNILSFPIPSYNYNYMIISLAYIELGEYKKSKQILNDLAMKKRPNVLSFVHIMDLLDLIAIREGDYNNTLFLYNVYKMIDPNNPSIQNTYELMLTRHNIHNFMNNSEWEKCEEMIEKFYAGANSKRMQVGKYYCLYLLYSKQADLEKAKVSLDFIEENANKLCYLQLI